MENWRSQNERRYLSKRRTGWGAQAAGLSRPAARRTHRTRSRIFESCAANSRAVFPASRREPQARGLRSPEHTRAVPAMKPLTLILRGARFYWRTHLGVVLGAALGALVLTGALLVGDS